MKRVVSIGRQDYAAARENNSFLVFAGLPDFLLPKLMSGKPDLSDVEIDTEAACA